MLLIVHLGNLSAHVYLINDFEEVVIIVAIISLISVRLNFQRVLSFQKDVIGWFPIDLFIPRNIIRFRFYSFILRML